MTLFNIDKNSPDRLNPQVNAPDVANNPMAHATASISPRAVGTQGQAKIITKDSRIIGFDGTNNIGLVGFDDAGNMVVKIAKTGFDANTATNDQLIFNSQQDAFKIANIVTGSLAPSFSSIASGGSSLTTTAYSTNNLPLPHGLTGTPAIVPYILNSNTGKYEPVSSQTLITTSAPNPQFIFSSTAIQGYAAYFWEFSVDGTNVTIKGAVHAGQIPSTTIPAYNFGSATFKIFCLQETAN